MNGLGRNDNNKKQQSTVFTGQTLGVVLVLFATVCLVCLITRDSIFYTPGKWINSFLLGCFGYFAYAVDVFVAYIGVMLVLSRKTDFSVGFKVKVTALFCLVALLLHVISHNDVSVGYGEYLASAYSKADNGLIGSTAGGLILSLMSYWVVKILSTVGSYVVISVLIAGVGYLLVKDYLKFKNTVQPETFKSSYVKENDLPVGVEVSGEKEYPVPDVVPVVSDKEQKSTQRLFINNAEDFSLKTKREIVKGKEAPLHIDYADNKIPLVQTNSAFPKPNEDDFKKKIEYIKTPATIDVDAVKNNARPTTGTTVSDYVSKTIDTVTVEPPKPVIEREPEREQSKIDIKEIPMFEHNGTENFDDTVIRAQEFTSRYASNEEPETVTSEPVETFRPIKTEEQPKEVLEPQVTEKPQAREFSVSDTVKEEKPDASPLISDRRSRSLIFEEEPKDAVKEEKTGFTSRVVADRNDVPTRSRLVGAFATESQPEPEQPKPEKKVAPINRIYNRPPIDLLEKYAVPVDAPKENHTEKMEIIKQLLADFHINVEPQGYVQGPTITRYEIMMPPGISVKKVLGYDDDLKMRLASKFGVRIEAPIPGKNLVGVEVANTHKVTVGLREVLEGVTEADKPGALTFAIGKDIVGKSITDNLAKGPHFLVAGATGSGKSVALNVMIVSLIMRYSPEELRLILIDPKRVGFRNYEHIPHLLIDEIITEPQKAVSVLAWAYEEMERRYGMFENCDRLISDIDEYNKEIASDTVAKLPRIVIIVDELADLMETCKKDMDAGIRKLAAKARAAGIHLVLATQRPSVDVITGTIKANLPSRMALKVMNYADSSTILSEGGAEKLLGNGDMLYKNSGMSECERYQGAWISNREITNVVNFIKEHNEAYFDDELSEFLEKSNKPNQEEAQDVDGEVDENEVSDLFLKALWLAVNSGSVSISQLQRRFQIGYGKAGGLVDKMERLGYISGNEGAKARRVFFTREQFEEKFGPMSDSY